MCKWCKKLETADSDNCDTMDEIIRHINKNHKRKLIRIPVPLDNEHQQLLDFLLEEDKQEVQIRISKEQKKRCKELNKFIRDVEKAHEDTKNSKLIFK